MVWSGYVRSKELFCSVMPLLSTTARSPDVLTPSSYLVGRVCKMRNAQPRTKYLVFLPALPLLLNLLLLFQFLCHAGLSQSLALASLIGFGVESCLQGCVPAHASHHLLSQLSKGKQLERLSEQGPDS